MKRILTFMLSIVLVLSMVLGLASCGNKSDYEAIKEKGKFVCGVTVYDPMNMKDEKGNWVGFDTEFAQAVAKKLGLEVEFVEIDWSAKYTELNSGNIDLIWNGFTHGNESDGKSRTEYVDFTYMYLENNQVIITKADRLEELNAPEKFVGLKGVVEGGSSGESVAKELIGGKDDEYKDNLIKMPSQAKALMELQSGNADFAVIDKTMADAMIGEGKDYADLAVNTAKELPIEYYAIGARKGSDFVEVLNKTMEELYEDGTLEKIAKTYKREGSLIKPTNK